MDEAKIKEITYFVSILFLFSLAMLLLLWIHPDMTFFQRQVAYHTTPFLLPLNPTIYTYCIDVPKNSSIISEIQQKITQFPFTIIQSSNYVSFCAKSLYREDEEIVNKYVDNLRANGFKVYISKARIVAKGIVVDIIPECVGWLGIFAMAALIIGYPKASWDKKWLGLVMCLPIIYLVNLLRIASVIWAGYWWGIDAMVEVHNILWEFLLVGVSLLLWIFWIKKVVKKGF